MSDEQLFTVYRQGIELVLPSYIGIMISHSKDPYEPSSVMECPKGSLHVAHIECRTKTVEKCVGTSMVDFSSCLGWSNLIDKSCCI